MNATIQEARQLKASAEARIREFTRGELEEFYKATGLSPDSITMDLRAIRTIGAPDTTLLTYVKLEVSL